MIITEHSRAFKGSEALRECYYVREKEWREKGPLDTYETDLLISFAKLYYYFFPAASVVLRNAKT